MADLSDVENTLVTLIAGILYPNGTSNPVSPLITAKCKVFRGWVVPSQLDQDIAASNAHGATPIINIGVTPPPGNWRKTTRYSTDFKVQNPATTTLTASIDSTGTQVTIGGTVSTPQNVAVLIGSAVAVVYAVQGSDSLNSIAAGLATLLTNAGVPATSTGPVVSVPSARNMVARVGGQGTVIQEVARQERRFWVTFWCHTPQIRDQVVPLIDVALKATEFLTMPDGTAARILPAGDYQDDGAQKSGPYRRDIWFDVEYATTQVKPATQIIVAETQLTGGLDPNAPPIATVYD